MCDILPKIRLPAVLTGIATSLGIDDYFLRIIISCNALRPERDSGMIGRESLFRHSTCAGALI
jgi:hypothetical protein